MRRLYGRVKVVVNIGMFKTVLLVLLLVAGLAAEKMQDSQTIRDERMTM